MLEAEHSVVHAINTRWHKSAVQYRRVQNAHVAASYGIFSFFASSLPSLVCASLWTHNRTKNRLPFTPFLQKEMNTWGT